MHDLLAAQAAPDLPGDLREIVEAGWTTGPAGTLLLAVQYRDRWNPEVGEADVGAYEYEINDIHVSTADLPVDEGLPARAAARGLTFALRAMERAAGLPGADLLAAVVSTPIDEEFLESGTTVKFFTRRGRHPDWFDDLERFQLDGVALVEMPDALGRR
ncbi:hypothetical protein DPM19_20490 [Actinomadura craniellae]|uniref:Uncharacterized protein n=2 Tax=Actinomadura craniellae TaxID=2231787 RepID=A0A365H374_9ACTN|nr:hypothetical protein DPM19_20490 [Actinomadura craniellae]